MNERFEMNYIVRSYWRNSKKNKFKIIHSYQYEEVVVDDNFISETSIVYHKQFIVTCITDYRIQDQLWSFHLNLSHLSFHFIHHIYYFTSFITSIILLHFLHFSDLILFTSLFNLFFCSVIIFYLVSFSIFHLIFNEFENSDDKASQNQTKIIKIQFTQDRISKIIFIIIYEKLIQAIIKRSTINREDKLSWICYAFFISRISLEIENVHQNQMWIIQWHDWRTYRVKRRQKTANRKLRFSIIWFREKVFTFERKI